MKYWCKTCKIFIADTKIDRTRHELSARHKDQTRRNLSSLHHTNKEEKRQSDSSKRVLEQIEKEIKASGKSPGSGPLHVSDSITEVTKSTVATKTTSKNQASPKRDSSQTKPLNLATPAAPVKPLFTKTIKVKETETTKWQAKEKVLAAPDLEIESLMGESTLEVKTNNTTVKKSMFKKRQGLKKKESEE
ncbi:uncharacterized protein SAPINGB_P002589 [Magnusiomyces paraingens]|uniref:U1-type domain-containing protein n=1 Tax=Magnusiomyces paraingens TaxID=2606893 RepID=A0A5E8BKG4_9ASCO|nr:uncharacterized protein SAPINGB_P002589 [Saprochaete ingens]VVT50077.1 unnamed protein product [Saprochaete ingens]